MKEKEREKLMTTEFRMLGQQNENTSTELAAEFLGTSIKGMLLVAFADGKLHWHERETLVESVRAIGDHVTAAQALKYLDNTAHLLGEVPESHWQGLFGPARRLPNEMKLTVLGLFMKLAFADGHLSPVESRLIHRIANWIDIDEENRQRWKFMVRKALDDGHAHGLKFTGMENIDWTGD
jgi:uncharacterized tellurite resistance protein B-like protein